MRAPILGLIVSVFLGGVHGAGINILTTMGHHEEALPASIGTGHFSPVTDSDGNVSRGSFCPNDVRRQEYVRELWKCLAGEGLVAASRQSAAKPQSVARQS